MMTQDACRAYYFTKNTTTKNAVIRVLLGTHQCGPNAISGVIAEFGVNIYRQFWRVDKKSAFNAKVDFF
jgi:hypothetical protein